MDGFNTSALQDAVNRTLDRHIPTEQPAPEPIVEEVEQEEADTSSIAEKTIAHKANNDYEANLKRQREKYEQELKQRDAEINRLKQLQRTATLNEDDIVEGKHYNDIAQQIRELREEAARERQRREQEQDILKLSTKYEDFNAVVNADTLKKLKEVDPEAFDAINAAPTLRAGGAAAYRIIKSLDLAQTNRTAERIEENLSKPGVARGNLAKMESFSQRMSDQEKRDKWLEVQRLARGG